MTILHRLIDDMEQSQIHFRKHPVRIELGHEEWYAFQHAIAAYFSDGVPAGNPTDFYGVPLARINSANYYKVIVDEKVYGDLDLLTLYRRYGDGSEDVDVLSMDKAKFA